MKTPEVGIVNGVLFVCVCVAVAKFYVETSKVFVCWRVMFYCALRVLCVDRLVQ